MLKNKKSLAVILSLVLLLAMACGAWALEPSADGIYRIGTATELAEFRDMVNAGSRDLNAKLTADISLAGIDWAPIGLHVLSDDVDGETAYDNLKEDLSYVGTFDGAGFKIQGLTASNVNAVRFVYPNTTDTAWYSEYAGGLFGVIGSGGIVQNITVENANVVLTTTFVPVTAGRNAAAIAGVSFGTVTNAHVINGTIYGTRSGGIVCHNRGLVEGCSVYILQVPYAYASAGGIVGRNLPTGKVVSCTVSEARLEGMFVGGIAGLCDDGALVSGCTVTGATTTISSPVAMATTPANARAGGIVGSSGGRTIENCLVDGIASISGYTAGGITGRSNHPTEIINCVVSGIDAITGEIHAGGISGRFDATMQNCIASGIDSITVTDTVTAGNGAGGIVGRMVGDNTVIENCAAFDIDSITGGNTGGAVGWLHSDVLRFQNCVVYDIGSISGDVNRFGAVVGVLNNANHATVVLDSQYEYGIVSPDRISGTGRNGTNVTSFDGSLISSDALDSLVVLLEQGASHTMYVEDTYDLDVTALPGTLGLGAATIVWSTEDLGFVSVAPSADGLKATVTAVAAGREKVTAKVTSATLNVEVSCFINVLEEGQSTPDADDIETTTGGTPDPDSIFPGTEVAITYGFGVPGGNVLVDDVDGGSGLAGSGLSVSIENGEVLLSGTATNSGTYYYDVTLLVDGEIVLKRVPVVVQAGSGPYSTGGGSSNCNAGMGIGALVSLLGLALVMRKK